jgi:hypothetical protein
LLAMLCTEMIAAGPQAPYSVAFEARASRALGAGASAKQIIPAFAGSAGDSIGFFVAFGAGVHAGGGRRGFIAVGHEEVPSFVKKLIM